MPVTDPIPIKVSHLLRPLDHKLIELLESLSDADWNRQTVAKKWKVKDVVTHLLDGNLRALSIQRDKYFGSLNPQIHGYHDLVQWLNQLNADWVEATRRISPSVLILLHKATGELVSSYFESLKPFEEAVFAVDWVGESMSYNWMHLAREYTEKWHHQQQIRAAVGQAGIMTREFFYPVMDTFFRALPHTFRGTQAESGTLIKATVTSKIGGSWFLLKEPEKWSLIAAPPKQPDAVVEISPEWSWQLFSKSVRPNEIHDQVEITGNKNLGKKVLEMVSVMA